MIRMWGPAATMLLVSLISYIDRNTLALLAPTILAETGLSGEQYGYIISAFSLAYMIGNPLWGVLLDRVGVRIGMTWAVSFWTIASAAHAVASGFWTFAGARALLGFGEGATFPGGLRTVVQTLPPGSRSRGIAVAYSGGSLGAIVTPLLVVPIAGHFGWRSAFWFTGFIGVAWLLLWRFTGRQIHSTASNIASFDLGASFRQPALWAFMAAYGLGALPLAFVIYGSAIYLNKGLGLSQSQIGWLLWIPPLGWEVGYFFWGWTADRLRRAGRPPFERLFATLMVLSLPLAATPLAHSAGVAMAAMFFAMFVAAGFVILPVAYATETLSEDSSGFLAGAGAGSWSAVVTLVMPVFGRMFDQGSYLTAFTVASLFPVAGFSLWFVLSRTRTN